jgi:two-component system chemotaxis response regulator CheB
MSKHDAISRIVADLPRDIRASILVVLHISCGRSLLPQTLTRAGRLRAVHPTDGEPLQYGRIYVGRPIPVLIAALVEEEAPPVRRSANDPALRAMEPDLAEVSPRRRDPHPSRRRRHRAARTGRSGADPGGG